MKVAILSNVNLDLLIQILQKENQVFKTVGYGNWISYALDADPNLIDFDPEVIFLLLDGNSLLEHVESYEEGCKEIHQAIGFVKNLSERYPGSTILVSDLDIQPRRIRCTADFGIEQLWEAEWLSELRELTLSQENMLIFNWKENLQASGGSTAYSSKMWYMGSVPYSLKTMQALALCCEEQLRRLLHPRKKVLVIDLDNTIWGGVAGEDGPEGIVLGESLYGAAYRDAQKRIHEIVETGILLAAVSKNNQEDVDAVFEKNPFMVLKKKDFVEIICNWEPKADNIRRLATSLNVGLDSFVFFDDNPVEREAVHSLLPEVSIAEFPGDSSALSDAVRNLYVQYFYCTRLTKEDQHKTEQYLQEKQRNLARNQTQTLDEYLKSLEIHIVLNQLRPSQFERAVQLLNKTNQCNTNTIRMNRNELERYLAHENNRVYVGTVSDRYGDSGLVILLMAQVDGNRATIEEFLMSCRVMGRKIEDSMLAALFNQWFDEGVREIRSSFVPTEKNKPAECLWKNMGFASMQSISGQFQYSFQLSHKQDIAFRVEWME